MSNNKQIRLGLEPVLKDGEKIVLYKKGSRGEVVAVYSSITEIVNNEKAFNSKFSSRSVHHALSGYTKSFTSLSHKAKVKPVIKKVNNEK